MQERLDYNHIYNMNCLDGLRQLEDESIDLTVTSCPYDNLRRYHDAIDEDTWNFEVFKPIAKELYRVTKKGCVVVWVVGDAVVNGGETGSSFRQALYFQEIGFKIHDTMIYEKNSSSFPSKRDAKRYSQIFEYMFVFSKGKIRDDIKLLADKKNKWAGWTNWGKHTAYNTNGDLLQTTSIKPIAEYSLRNNIWKYSVGFNDKTGHPAVFPEKLAEDNILSWSKEGDVVLDPFMGSGTTAKMAMINNRRYIGFELNPTYCQKAIERVEKYRYTKKNAPKEVVIGDFGQTALVFEDDINTIEEKTKIWNEKIAELNKYFNEQSVSILKTLTFSFSSKSNDKRVEKRLNKDSSIEDSSTEQTTLFNAEHI